MTTTSPKTAEPVDLGAVAALRFAVTRLARQLRQEALADGGLTPSKLNALASINRLGPISLGDLAVVERVSAATVSRTVDALAAAGFVERSSDPTDGRVVFVTMTVAGVKVLDGSRRRKDAVLAQRVSLLGARDQARLVAAIPVLQRLLDDEPS
jgi:DNA-binding MarR family transcriptional regulator